MRYVGSHRDRTPRRFPIRHALFGALVLVTCGLVGGALEDLYAPAPVGRPPSVRLVPQDPPPACALPLALVHEPGAGAQQGAALGARVGCDEVVAQLAAARLGLAP